MTVVGNLRKLKKCWKVVGDLWLAAALIHLLLINDNKTTKASGVKAAMSSMILIIKSGQWGV